MVKLELKHLSPYLPYRLKIQHKTIFQESGYESVDTLTSYNIPNVIESDKRKPILRPLSDLSRVGCKETTINEHTINTLLGYGDIEFSHFKGDLDFIHEGNSSQRYDSSKTISFKTFETVRAELLKGHFDVFGLIEKGLAIDINTLEK